MGGNTHRAQLGGLNASFTGQGTKMYGYRKNGERLYTGEKAIERVHLLNDGVPLCEVSVILCVVDYKMGKPVCGACRSQIKRNKKLERLQDQIKRSQELF